MWCISKLSVVYHFSGKRFENQVPCLHYNKEFRQRFGGLSLLLKDFDSGLEEYYEFEQQWGSIDEILRNHSIYGCLNLIVSQDGFLDCTLIVVDEMAYKFLTYVDVLTMVYRPSNSRRRSDWSPLWNNIATQTFYALDEDMTLLGLRTGYSVHGGFPLMHVVMSMEKNWREDGNFYLSFKNNVHEIYMLDFTDKRRARNLLAKASIMYGKDKFRSGVDAMKQLALW